MTVPASAPQAGKSAGHSWVYWPATALAWCILAVIAKVRILRTGTLPKEGGCLLASNHISHFDPPFLSTSFGRRIDWFAMADLFRAAWSAKLLYAVGAISVERNSDDRAAVRAAILRLRQGRVVGIFPEGGIRDGARSIVNGGPMQAGAAMIAVRAATPVVPVVILGSERFYNAKHWLPWRRTPVWIGVGAPVHPLESVPHSEARARLQLDLAEAFVKLRDALREKFSLRDEDMPHSPQERMREP